MGCGYSRRAIVMLADPAPPSVEVIARRASAAAQPGMVDISLGVIR